MTGRYGEWFDIDRMQYTHAPHLPNKDEGLFDVTETAASADLHEKKLSRDRKVTPHFHDPEDEEKNDESA